MPRESRAALFINAPNYIGLTDGLVGNWSFDGPTVSGTDPMKVNDLSGQGNQGSASGSNIPKRVAGKIGQALDFDGSDNLISVPENASLNDLFSANGGTISLWVYARSMGEGNNSDIIGKHDAAGANNEGWRLGFTNSGAGTDRVIFTQDYATTALQRRTTDNGLTRNEWQHLVVTWDGTSNASNVHIYRNTVEALGGSTINGVGDFGSDALEPLTIGNYRNGSRTFDGLIDDVRIYNRALSPTEIKRLYKIGGTVTINKAKYSGSLEEGLVGAWHFDGLGLQDGYAPDESGQGRRGTLSGNPKAIKGKAAGALELDGSADFVDVGAGPSSVNAVSFWAYPQTTTEYFVNLTGTTDYIWLNSGTLTATGFASPRIFVDGVETSTLVVGEWQHVVVMSDTAENASNLDLGRTADANYLQGRIDDVRMYDRTLTPDEIKRLHNVGGTITINKAPNEGSIADGLVGYWDFDGNSLQAGYALDKSGNDNRGTLVNGPKPAKGRLGQALEFDGGDDRVDMGSPSSLDNVNTFTYSAWIKPNGAGESNRGFIVDKHDFRELHLDNNTLVNGLRLRVVRSGSEGSLSANNVYTIGEWKHVAVTFDPNNVNNLHIYVNGAEVPAYNTRTIGSGTIDDSLANFYLGNEGNSARTFNGQIDDVRVYNRVLSPTEIKRLYNPKR